MLTFELLKQRVRRGAPSHLESAREQRFVTPDADGMNPRAFDGDREQGGAGRTNLGVLVPDEMWDARGELLA